MAGIRRRLGALASTRSKTDRLCRRTPAPARGRRRTPVGLAVLVGLATLVPTPATAEVPYGPWDFDIVDASVNPSTVAQGNSVTLSVSIQNVGDEIGTVKVYAGIERPNGVREYLAPHTIADLPVGQTASTSWPYTPSAGTGQYKVDFDVVSPVAENPHQFDTTGFVHNLNVVGSPNDPTASRGSPSSGSVSLQAGDTQTFEAALSDADCDLLYAEWYLDGVPVHPDELPVGCSSVTSWTGTFPSTGSFVVEVVVFDSRNDGNHVGRTDWLVSVTPGDPVPPGDCSISGTFLRFSGRDWEIRPDQQGGPSDNTWRANNVSCNADGHLVLKMTYQGGVWTSAQVTTLESFHYGRYEWKVKGPVDDLDKNVNFALFNYGGVDNEDEIDIELTRWGDPNKPNGNYVVFPDTATDPVTFEHRKFEFDLRDGDRSTHMFSWQRNRVSFQSFEGGRSLGSTTFEPTDFVSRIPQNPLPVYINLWLVNGHRQPSNGAGTEVVIESFSWQPEATPTSLRLPPPLG